MGGRKITIGCWIKAKIDSLEMRRKKIKVATPKIIIIEKTDWKEKKLLRWNY